jgi:hypothetical protein
MRDLRLYLLALYRHMKQYLTGSAVVAVLTWGLAILAVHTVPKLLWVIPFILGLPVAGFYAWREEHRKLGRPDPRVGERIKELLRLKESGINEIVNATAPLGYAEAVKFGSALWDKAQAWQDQVANVLPSAGARESEVSHFAYVGSFISLGGVTRAERNTRGIVAKRAEHLDELIRTLEQRNMGAFP